MGRRNLLRTKCGSFIIADILFPFGQNVLGPFTLTRPTFFPVNSFSLSNMISFSFSYSPHRLGVIFAYVVLEKFTKARVASGCKSCDLPVSLSETHVRVFFYRADFHHLSITNYNPFPGDARTRRSGRLADNPRYCTFGARECVFSGCLVRVSDATGTHAVSPFRHSNSDAVSCNFLFLSLSLCLLLFSSFVLVRQAACRFEYKAGIAGLGA